MWSRVSKAFERSNLSKCPYHLNLHSFTILLHSFTPYFSYRSSFLILSGHLIIKIFLKVFLWKTSTVFSRFFVRVHSSSSSRISFKTSNRSFLLTVSNALDMSKSKMYILYFDDVIAFSAKIFMLKTCSVVCYILFHWIIIMMHAWWSNQYYWYHCHMVSISVLDYKQNLQLSHLLCAFSNYENFWQALTKVILDLSI